MIQLKISSNRVVLCSIVLLSLCGCGKKGTLIPPEALAPAPVADLALAQKGGYFQASWSAPTKQKGGGRLSNLAGFTLLRRMPLPADLDCEECPGAYAELARIDLDYLGQARRIGNLLLFDDHDLKRGSSYQYKVRSFTTDGTQSSDSNRARRRFHSPPLPPALKATSSDSSVTLAFTALPPEEGKLLGYNVYRCKSGAQMPLAPLTPLPVTGTSYEDKDLLIGVHYSYTVRSVAATLEGETVESVPSNLAEGEMILQPD
jgi:predicted small lipoprotein YifL